MSEDRSEQQSRIPGLTNQERLDIRDHSKKYYPIHPQHDRKAVAAEIKGIRNERQQVKAAEVSRVTLKQDLIGKRQEMLSKQETLAQKLTDSEEELRAREVSLVSRVVDLFAPKRKKAPLEATISSLPRDIQATQLEADGLQRQLLALDDEIRRTLTRKLSLKDDRAVLEGFYNAWGRQLNTKKERDALAEYIPRHGTLSVVVNTYNCYVMHAIQPDIKVNVNNKVLNSHVPWEDRLAMLVDIQPAISTSALVEGSQIKNSWAGIGVFCSGDGYIESAGVGDRGTRASGIKERTGQVATIDEYNRNLSWAILSPHTNGININELIVSGDYSISGLYINLDDRRLSGNAFHTGWNSIMVTRGGRKQMTNNITFSDVFTVAMDLGMPLFVYEQGKAYEATLDQTGSIVKGKEVPPKEMVKRKYIVPDDKKQALRDATRRSLRSPGVVAALV